MRLPDAEAASAFALKVDYRPVARTAIQKVQQELATKRVRSELKNTEKLDIMEKNVQAESNDKPKSRGLKLNVISGNAFGMTRKRSKIMSIISVVGHQVVKNLSEPSEITPVHLHIYANYSREKDFKLDPSVVRALLTTGGSRLMRVEGRVLSPIPNSDECKRSIRPDLHRKRGAHSKTNWTQCHP